MKTFIIIVTFKNDEVKYFTLRADNGAQASNKFDDWVELTSRAFPGSSLRESIESKTTVLATRIFDMGE
jgi:hypothetical protein